MLFSPTFDLVVGIILLVLSIVFFLGKGEPVLNAFNGKNAPKSNRSPENEKKYQLAIGIFLLALAACELTMAFWQSLIMSLIAVAVAVIGLIVMAVLTKRLDG